MIKRFSSALSIVILGVMVFSLVGEVKPAEAAGLCNAASFVADVTIPDGTYINPGSPFTKTWRLKNIGTCSWSNKYSLVFVSGQRMDGLSPIFLTRFVGPNQTVDVSVDLTAPTSGGTFRGYWELQNASGTKFGVGAAGGNPFWVEIRVLSPSQSSVAYDFVANMCNALWVYNGGGISCPVNNNKLDFGYVMRIDNPVMETGQTLGASALLTVPQNKFNGVIQGIFPVDDIFRGDHFQTVIGCEYGAINCAVTYQLDYAQGDNMVTLWKFKEQYDGLYYQVDLDLSSVANRKDAKMVLSVYAAGPAIGDRPLWVNPRIVRNVQAPVVTPTPPPPTPVIPTITPITPSCTNRAQFVTDTTVPDGTVFAPNAPFFKVWRLKNVGTCTWTTAYSLTFVSGERMSGADTLLSQTVTPGQTADLGVNLIAPSFAGSYRGNWELKDASGNRFGLGSGFDQPFWVAITVSGSATPVSPTMTPTSTSQAPTATSQAPTATTAATTPSPTPFSTGWTLYRNTKYAFAFQIPPGSSISSQADNGGRVYLPITVGTNLAEKYLDINVVEGATTCLSPYSSPSLPSQTVTINGIQFTQQSATEGAVGNIYDWTAYSTTKGTACISLTFLLHSLNPGAFVTPPVLFDKAAESAVFSSIMSTYGNQ